MNLNKRYFFLLLGLLLYVNFIIAQTASVSGKVTTAIEENISNVTVLITGTNLAQSTKTDENGNFSFENIPINLEVSFSLTKEDKVVNGVTSRDIYLIVSHILGVQLLDTADKYLASDVNESGSITAFDLVQMQQLILAIVPVFPNSTSWRFVHPTDLMAINLEEVGDPATIPINFSNNFQIRADAPNIFNFIGLKVGDVNYTADR